LGKKLRKMFDQEDIVKKEKEKHVQYPIHHNATFLVNVPLIPFSSPPHDSSTTDAWIRFYF
jgi:hypothetical protein